MLIQTGSFGSSPENGAMRLSYSGIMLACQARDGSSILPSRS